MQPSRRIGSKKSVVRAAIIEAGIAVLSEAGASGLSASQIAKKLNIKPHMVHYYFRTMDDLVVELVRYIGREGMRKISHALVSDRPLHAIWELEMTSPWGVMALELQAIAAHSQAVRSEIVRYLEEVRFIEAEAVSRYFALRGFEPPVEPLALVQVVVGMARQLVRERTLGLELGHGELISTIEQFLAGIPGGEVRKRSRAKSVGKAEAAGNAEPAQPPS